MQVLVKRMKFLCLILFFCLAINLVFAAGIQPLPDGQFVTVKDGHLFYNGQRLRLWGTNFVCNVKRQGKDLELSFDRMVDAGFNGIRVNIFNCTFLSGTPQENAKLMVPVTVKGSNSPMDLLDYSIYLAKQRGMFFWLSFTTGLGPENYEALPDDGTKEEWKKMIADGGAYAMYYDERAEKTFQQYAKNILEHVNPYTGKRYADEETIGLYEIINENGFVESVLSNGQPGAAGKKLTQKWNTWLKEKYKTDEELVKAWGKLNSGESLAKNSIAFQPVQEGVATYRQAGVQKEYESKDKKNLLKYPYRRGEDLARFVCELYQGHTQRFIKFVRSLGKPGVGISMVPITPTGRYGLSIPTYYAASCGDFVSMGVYGFAVRPWEVKKDNPYYPYVVRTNYHPLMEQPIDLFRAKGKPYLLYECNDTRPNPFTMEFPARIAAYLIWQDADGAFWFHWDSDGYLHDLKTDEDYTLKNRLPIPDRSYPNAGLIHANDEAFLAALKSVGTLFKTGSVPPAAKPMQVTIGKDYLLNLSASLLGGLENLSSLENVLREKVWRYGMRVTYDPDGPTVIPDQKKEPHGLIRMGPNMQVFWNGTEGYFRVDAPSAKMYTGFLKPFLDFNGKVRITEIDRTYGMISIVAEDGLPLEKSSSILITAMSRGQNTGQQVQPENLTTTDYWQQGIAQMCSQSGTLPIVVDRVSAVIHAPWLKGLKYQKYNFFRKCFDQGTVGESFVLRGYEPVFYARLVRPQPKVIRKMVATGNSITWHPPLANSDWNNNWGMAATSQDKDWVHRVHRYVTENQKGVTPELIVENFGDRQVVDPAKHEKLAAFKADLYVIQFGDNLKDEDCNEKTLGKPYEEMLKTIKKANPNAVIVCASTWGCSKNKDPLMRAACERQGVPFVRIDIFIGDVKNRALGEGHFKHGGVNWHPGDLGMQKIADALWPAIKTELEK